MSENSMRENSSAMTRRDRIIPWYFVMFFAVIFVLDGIFVWIAIDTHTGVINENAYETGLAYNDVLARAERDESLGWNADISVEGGNTLNVALTDADKAGLAGAAVVAKLVRPTQGGHDFTVALFEGGTGVYTGRADFPMAGQWDVHLRAVRGEDAYHTVKRVVIDR